jgi:acyl carrier protein
MSGAPASSTLAAIRRTVERETGLDLDIVGSSDDLWAAGMSSLQSVYVMMAIEDEFGIKFPPPLLTRETFSTLAAMETAVNAAFRGSARDLLGDDDG